MSRRLKLNESVLPDLATTRIVSGRVACAANAESSGLTLWVFRRDLVGPCYVNRSVVGPGTDLRQARLNR
jgi:hypothetical protein